MITCYQTDPGKVRSHNEDCVTIVKNASDEYLVVVADGMGGHKAGEVASSLVVNELGKRFSLLSSIGTKEEAVIWLMQIIDEINVKILKYAEEHVDASGLDWDFSIRILWGQKHSYHSGTGRHCYSIFSNLMLKVIIIFLGKKNHR